jgi:hypothetical protein
MKNRGKYPEGSKGSRGDVFKVLLWVMGKQIIYKEKDEFIVSYHSLHKASFC